MNGIGGHRAALSKWRIAVVIVLMLTIWTGLAARLFQIQWYSQASFATRADRQRTRYEAIPARPGEIVDRHGHVLAMTITRRSLFVDPSRLTDRWETARELAGALNLNADELFRYLADRSDRRFLWIKRRLSDDEVERVRGLNLEDSTWGFRNEYQRRYPQGHLAAHLLGTRNIDNHGHGGLEQSFDAAIRGANGRRKLILDARGTIIDLRDEAQAQHGITVVSTIDSLLQIHVERQLDDIVRRWQPRGAAAIVMQPQTGEILAMASRPVFDPNAPQTNTAWQNLCISAVYEPGSTIKPFVVGWAMQQQLTSAGEVFDCENGAYRMKRRVLHDEHPYGLLSLTDVLVKSSNIGMAKIGERLTNNGLYRALLTFGFVRRTGIELPGESNGLVRPLQEWNDYSTGSVPMGHEIAITPIQLITAHAALANHGRMVYPRLTRMPHGSAPTPVDTVNSHAAPAPVIAQTIRPEIAQWLVRHPMREVVRRGTARAVETNGESVFGKTGTAQKLTADGPQGHVCSFVGGAPAENPQVLVLVVVDQPTTSGPHFGGTVAAPAAAKVLRMALRQQLRLSRR